jgi:transcription termination factor Rho
VKSTSERTVERAKTFFIIDLLSLNNYNTTTEYIKVYVKFSHLIPIYPNQKKGLFSFLSLQVWVKVLETEKG